MPSLPNGEKRRGLRRYRPKFDGVKHLPHPIEGDVQLEILVVSQRLRCFVEVVFEVLEGDSQQEKEWSVSLTSGKGYRRLILKVH